MNIYIFNGTLGQDAEVKTLDSGSSVISFSVAITEKWKDKSGEQKEKTTWVRCTKWVAQNGSTKIADYLKKGQQVIVRGIPDARAWLDKEGAAKANLEVKVDELSLVGGKKAESQESASNVSETSYTQTPQAQADPFGGATDDQLPF